MSAIAFLLLAAALGFGIAHVLRIPAIPVVMAFGVACSALLPIPEEFLEDALMLGVVVVVFVAGIELNPDRVGRYRGTAIRVGLLQFLVLGGAGLGAATLLGFAPQTAAYLGLALAASSTLVVIRLLQQRRELYTPMGRMVTGILLLQDLLVVLLIPVVTHLDEGPRAVGMGLGATLGLMALAAVLLRWVAPRVLPRIADDEELLLLTVLATLFVFLGLSHFLEIPLVGGAFLAGVALSPFPVNALVRGQLNSLGSFFSALFFAALGAILTLPTAAELLQALVLAGIIVIVTPPLVALVAERSGFSARAGIGSGLLLSQASEFSLVVGLQGMILGQITEGAFTIIVLVTVMTMILTPVLATSRVTGRLVRLHPFRAQEVTRDPPRDHILLVGCGSSGVALLETLFGTPREIWVVDDDPAVVGRVQEAGFAVVRGDATDVGILRSAGADQAHIVVSTIRQRDDSAALLAMAGEVPVLVRAFDDTDAKWIEDRGGVAVSYADAATDEFMAWFREEVHEDPIEPSA